MFHFGWKINIFLVHFLSFLWDCNRKKYVPLINLCMWNHVATSFWMKNQYFPGSLLKLPMFFHRIGMVKNMFYLSIYVCGTPLVWKKYLQGVPKFHRIVVILIENSIFSWFSVKASWIFLWDWNGKTNVPFINLRMWNHVEM